MKIRRREEPPGEDVFPGTPGTSDLDTFSLKLRPQAVAKLSRPKIYGEFAFNDLQYLVILETENIL